MIEASLDTPMDQLVRTAQARPRQAALRLSLTSELGSGARRTSGCVSLVHIPRALRWRHHCSSREIINDMTIVRNITL